MTPTMKQRGYGGQIDNYKVMITQAPFDLRLNYILTYLIILKLLIRFDRKHRIRGPTYMKYAVSGSNSSKFEKYLLENLDVPVNPLTFIEKVDIHDTYMYNKKLQSYQYHHTKDMVISYIHTFQKEIDKKIL